MSHLIVLPVLLPVLAGTLLLFTARRGLTAKRLVSTAFLLAQLPVAAMLLIQAARGDIIVYALGNWAPPFGIVLVLDRLGALMVAMTAVLSLFVLIYALRGGDRQGRNFHSLFHFQLMGLYGAFLTGDLFNLFVFFEILLIASYALLLHGGGADRARAGLHYVILNLVGSTFFLVGVGVLYGLTGTLNMADLAVRVAAAPAADAPILAAAGLVLLVVFGLKAAMLPLYFWLPRAYASATAPVAALFAVMTKMGFYAILRVYSLIFGPEAGELADLALPWLWPMALITVGLGAIGAAAAATLQRLAAYLIVLSVGTLLAGLALGNAAGITAALYYLLHTTWVSGALFLLADLIAGQRGELGARLVAGPPLRQPALLGLMFFAGAVAVAGMPPLSGFFGKILLLGAAPPGAQAAWLWTVVLGGSLATLIALSRAGSTLFWRTAERAGDAAGAGDAGAEAGPRADGWRVLAAAGLLATSPALVVFGEAVMSYAGATAEQLLHPARYVEAVLSSGAMDVTGGPP